MVFKDITPMLADPAAFAASSRRWPRPGATRRAGRWSTTWSGWRRAGSSSPRRWRWPSAPGSCRCARPGKLPRETYAETYALEYGEATLEVHRDGLKPGDRVLLVDDVLATGGTVAATRRLVESAVRSRTASRC